MDKNFETNVEKFGDMDISITNVDQSWSDIWVKRVRRDSRWWCLKICWPEKHF